MPRRAGSFAGLTLTHLPNGESTLTGFMVDQSALHGVMNDIRDLGIPLLSVNQLVEPTEKEM